MYHEEYDIHERLKDFDEVELWLVIAACSALLEQRGNDITEQHAKLAGRTADFYNQAVARLYKAIDVKDERYDCILTFILKHIPEWTIDSESE